MADVLDAGGLSKQQFRWKIFESLRESGVTDRLKSQLRAHIVNEIRVSTNGNLPTTSTPKSLHLSRKRNQSSGTNGIVEIEGTGETDELLNEADPAKPQPGTLMTRVVDSLIIDYLRMKGSEFTLSVFMPECGLTRASQMFAEEDIFRALHLDHDTTLLRMLRKNLHSMPSTAILVRVLGSLSKIGNVNVMEREAQTDIDDAEYLEMQIRKADRDNTFQNRESNRMMAKSIEERMQRYQSDLEARMKLELEQQLAKFKEIEVASMRVEERQKFAIEITHVKGDYEARMLQQRERLAESNDDIRRKLDAREKEIERGNLEFRQRLLDEGNRNLMTERNLRSEAELAAKSLTLERDSLQRRLDEARSEIGELHGFKDRYTAKMQEAMSQYKIDLNKEHAGILQAAQVERAKIETEKLVLDEKIKAVEQMMQQTRDSQHEMEELRLNLKETRVQLDETIREREDALHEVRELKLQVSSHKTSTALEFEIQSLKIQLVDAEKMAIKRQEDYQSLLKSLMGPKEETQKELLKARKGEQKWQRQCSELVAKLDIEMNRADEWQRKYDDEVVRCKELLREISDLRNVLHQTRAAMGVDQQHLGDALKSLGGPRSTLPDPYNAIDPAPHRIPHQTLPDPRYSPQPFHSPHLRPVPQPYQYSPNRSITPDVRPPIRFNDAWTQGYDRMYAGLDPPHLDRLLSESHETKRYDATHWDWVPRDHPAPTAPQPQDMLPPVEGVGSGFADDVMQSFSSDVKSPPTKSKAAQAASTVLAPRSQLPVPSSSSSPIPNGAPQNPQQRTRNLKRRCNRNLKRRWTRNLKEHLLKWTRNQSRAGLRVRSRNPRQRL
ncbi:hypothetical protein BC829DRAFT_125968 [Chytridium lagenaria]|nr:hypothetical protein BC829DRAFT_125968 [Chytridium lagenaria]